MALSSASGAVDFALMPLSSSAPAAPATTDSGLKAPLPRVESNIFTGTEPLTIFPAPKKPKKVDRVEDPRKVAISFASAVTTQTPVGWGWVARNGEESLFSAFQRIVPELIQPGDGHHRYRLKGKISCPEFNKVLQAFCGFICSRTRKKSLTRTAGNWLFCNRRWLDPTDPTERAVLEYNYDVLCATFPIFSHCPKPAFLQHLASITLSWSERMKDATRKKGNLCSSPCEDPEGSPGALCEDKEDMDGQLGQSGLQAAADIGDRRVTCEEILVGSKRKKCQSGSAEHPKPRKPKQDQARSEAKKPADASITNWGLDPRLLEAAEMEWRLDAQLESKRKSSTGNPSARRDEDDSPTSRGVGGQSNQNRSIAKLVQGGKGNESLPGGRQHCTYKAAVAKEPSCEQRPPAGAHDAQPAAELLQLAAAAAVEAGQLSSSIAISLLLNPPGGGGGTSPARSACGGGVGRSPPGAGEEDAARRRHGGSPDHQLLQLPPIAPEVSADSSPPGCHLEEDGEAGSSLETLSALCEKYLVRIAATAPQPPAAAATSAAAGAGDAAPGPGDEAAPPPPPQDPAAP